MMLFSKKKLIGLDIGTSSIKAAIVDGSGRGVVLKRFAIHETPESSIVSGEVMDSMSLAGALGDIAATFKGKKKEACTALWGSGAIVKKISIPRMETSLIREQIHWEAEQYIPFDINEVQLDYHLLKSSSSSETMDILLVAAKRDFVGKLVDVVENAGLQLGVLDVAGFALANCFQVNYGKFRGETIALLNIGAGVTNFVVIENGEVIFCRDLPVGGANYTSEIQKQMGISMQEAETLKISASGGIEAPTEVQGIISAVNNLVVEEIGAGLDFFSATGAGNAISRIFMTGGCVYLPDLHGALAQAFQVPCEPFDPFHKISVDIKGVSRDYVNKIRPFAAVALGLAMRESEQK